MLILLTVLDTLSSTIINLWYEYTLKVLITSYKIIHVVMWL